MLTHKFVALGHNTIRGAAGASILNAELMKAEGLLCLMIVMKFGGTSVADRAAIERLIGIVRAARQAAIQPESADWRGPIVVVSALGGATDRLLGVAAEAGAGDVEGAREHVHALRDRHLEVARRHHRRPPSARRSSSFITREFDELERIVGALSVLREVTPRWLDAIAATGEILSSRIVAAALTSHGLAASWVDARRVMVTTKEHTARGAALRRDRRRAGDDESIRCWPRGAIPVIGGFVGATPDGVTTTLGRGGSDYSAAIVGAGLGASEIQIWTDVDGMLTADPRIVARRAASCRIFRSPKPPSWRTSARRCCIRRRFSRRSPRTFPVRILNSMRPQDAIGHAHHARASRRRSGPLTAVASKKNVTVVDITSTRMLMAHGFLKRIFEVFEQHRTSVDVVTTSEVSVSVTIDDARRVPEIMDSARRRRRRDA